MYQKLREFISENQFIPDILLMYQVLSQNSRDSESRRPPRKVSKKPYHAKPFHG